MSFPPYLRPYGRRYGYIVVAGHLPLPIIARPSLLAEFLTFCHSSPRLVGAKNLASVVGRHFICHSGREGSHSRLTGAGFRGTGLSGQQGGEVEVQSTPAGEIAH